MAQLRDPHSGCEWDLQQTFETIAPYTIEEAYEVADAIQRRDLAGLRDELGDLLLQVVFHARMAEEQGLFDFEDVAASIGDKLERRHPHVFGDRAAGDAETVRRNWEAIKTEERENRHGPTASLMDDVPQALPALKRSQKLGQRAASVGFDWATAAGARRKIDEELAELDRELDDDDREGLGREIGDIFFSLVNLARHLDIDAEAAAAASARRFEARFRAIEALALREGKALSGLDEEGLDALWRRVKAMERADSSA